MKLLADERRREILESLCLRRFDTMGNLAFEFGVCRATIAVDIVRLSCRYPIYTKSGYGGGVFVEEWYELDMKYFTEKQTELVERILPYLNGEDYKTMETIIRTFRYRKRREKKNTT